MPFTSRRRRGVCFYVADCLKKLFVVLSRLTACCRRQASARFFGLGCRGSVSTPRSAVLRLVRGKRGKLFAEAGFRGRGPLRARAWMISGGKTEYVDKRADPIEQRGFCIATRRLYVLNRRTDDLTIQWGLRFGSACASDLSLSCVRSQRQPRGSQRSGRSPTWSEHVERIIAASGRQTRLAIIVL